MLFAVLGYCREFFFVQLNIIMYSKYYGNLPPVPTPAVMRVFEAWQYNTLYYSKYLFTILSTAIYYGVNRFTLKKVAATSMPLVRVLNIAYLLVIFISGVSMLYAYFVTGHLNRDEYTLSRWLMGIAQSPLICLILLASEKLYTKTLNT